MLWNFAKSLAKKNRMRFFIFSYADQTDFHKLTVTFLSLISFAKQILS